MRIGQMTKDWKEQWSGAEIARLSKEVGGQELVYEFDQNEVDSDILYFSSEPITDAQLQKLWEVGDLWTEDQIWEGTFEEILAQIKDYVKKQEEEVS